VSDTATVLLSLKVRVNDAQALRGYATKRLGVAFGQTQEEANAIPLAQLVLEALVLSNENPPPEDYGIEILDQECHAVGLETPSGFKAPEPWDEHPDYPRKDWQYEVQNNDTNLGYAEWCLHKFEADAEDR